MQLLIKDLPRWQWCTCHAGHHCCAVFHMTGWLRLWPKVALIGIVCECSVPGPVHAHTQEEAHTSDGIHIP